MIDLLSALAGILYNNWPLGYILNPHVAHASLASGLEAVHQPYNWLFVGGDVVSSLIIIGGCWLLWRRYGNRQADKTVRLALFCATLFGIGTIGGALIPERCVPNLMVCPRVTHDPNLLIHGAFSILASVFLFVALLALWLRQRRSLLLTLLVVAYAVFGAISLIQAVVPGQNGNWSQDYYMILCGIWVACLPYACRRAVAPQSTRKQQRLSDQSM